MHPRPITRSGRAAALLATLLFTLSATAQQEYHEGSITYSDRNGVRSDTVSYYTAGSNRPERTVIRLGGNALRIQDFNPGNGSFLREWTEMNGQPDGMVKEWYAEGKPRSEEEYRTGRLDGPRRTWDESGRLTAEERYRNGTRDGKAKKWHYEGPDWGEIEIASHSQSNSPYMVERFAFVGDQQGLIERTIPDPDGATLYSARKSDCDSTRIDSLCAGRMMVEIRDFREGRIQSLERYDATARYGTLIPHGVFELYAPDGRLGTRMLYDEGELILSRDYDEDLPCEDVTTTPLPREDGDRLLAESSDSKYLNESQDCRPLCIRNRADEVILWVDEADRRYEYRGYDPHLHLHVGVSSEGSWDDIRWYAVYDNDGAESVLELHEELLAVHGTTGLIAASSCYFEGEQELQVYRLVQDEAAAGFYEQVFACTLPEVPAAIWAMHWVGENSLLLVMEKGSIRVDIAPESLTWQEEEI